MSTKAQVKTQAKTTGAPGPGHFRQPPVAVSEREADRPDIATQLQSAVRLGHSFGALGADGPAPPIVQRQELPEEEQLQLKREPVAVQRQELLEEEEELQMKPESDALQWRVPGEGFRLDDETAGRINRARGGGQPLDGALQEQMGGTMGHDFNGVRVHSDSEADALNQQLSAKAFTTGQDLFFRQGEYNPGSDSGRELIGHELTHVVQQSTGRVRGHGSGMTVRPAGDVFEREADAVWQRFGNRIAQRQWVVPAGGQEGFIPEDETAGRNGRENPMANDVAFLANAPSALQRVTVNEDVRKWDAEQRRKIWDELKEGKTTPMKHGVGGVCYDAVAFALYLGGVVTWEQLSSTTGEGWVPLFSFVTKWSGGDIPEGKAVGFKRTSDAKHKPNEFFHAALSVGGTTVRGVNGLKLGGGWIDKPNIKDAIQKKDDAYVYDGQPIEVWYSA